eukprot:5100291-Prymnesium_polylepis.1
MRRLGPEQARYCPECGIDTKREVSNGDIWRLFDSHRRTWYANTIFLTKHPGLDKYGGQHYVRGLNNYAGENNVSWLLQRAAPCPKALVVYNWKRWLGDSSGCSEARLAMLKSLPEDSRVVQEFCSASVTRVLDLILKVRYPNVALIGVDLTSPLHFYTVLPEYTELAAEVRGISFEQVAVRSATARYGGQVHATGARGVHHFLERVARERCTK